MPIRKSASSSMTEKSSTENLNIELNDFETLTKSLSEVLELVDSLTPKKYIRESNQKCCRHAGKASTDISE